jgi:DnaJ homolog subfamily C member 27
MNSHPQSPNDINDSELFEENLKRPKIMTVSFNTLLFKMDKRRQSSLPGNSAVAASAANTAAKKVQAVRQFAPIERIKIISMGSGGCGKSCLIKRYCEERFVTKYIATIGVDYGVKPVKIDGADVRVNFWDLSGHAEFFEIRNEFYKDAQGCLLVFDVSSRESFDECDSWLAECSKYGANPREMPITLCANKIDKKRIITEDEARSYAQSRGLVYFELCAATGQNVNEMFDHLFQMTFRKTKSAAIAN